LVITQNRIKMRGQQNIKDNGIGNKKH
jgi:hypothetical protein